MLFDWHLKDCCPSVWVQYLKKSRMCSDYSWSCCYTHFLMKWPFQVWHILCLLKFRKSLDFNSFSPEIIWCSVYFKKAVHSEAVYFSTFSENSFSAHFMWGFRHKENKQANIMKQWFSSAVLVAAFGKREPRVWQAEPASSGWAVGSLQHWAGGSSRV